MMLSDAFEDVYARNLLGYRGRSWKPPQSDHYEWIDRFWEIYYNRDLQRLEPHLKAAPIDMVNPADAISHHGIGERMIVAACKEHVDVQWLEILIRNGSKQLQAALGIASKHENILAVECLLRHGVDPMIPSAYNCLPFHEAIKDGKLSMIKFWMDRYPAMIFKIGDESDFKY